MKKNVKMRINTPQEAEAIKKVWEASGEGNFYDVDREGEVKFAYVSPEGSLGFYSELEMAGEEKKFEDWGEKEITVEEFLATTKPKNVKFWINCEEDFNALKELIEQQGGTVTTTNEEERDEIGIAFIDENGNLTGLSLAEAGELYFKEVLKFDEEEDIDSFIAQKRG